MEDIASEAARGIDTARPSLYTALPNPKSIRLMRLSDGDETGINISCTTYAVDIDECPPFYALSYTWGPATIDPEAEEPTSTQVASKVNVNICESAIEQQPDEDQTHDHGRAFNYFTISINQNLADFLTYFGSQQLRCPTLPPLYSYLWIDAICIDQSNKYEVLNQISLMGQLYQSARSVLVWLGKDETGFEDFQWLHEGILDNVYQGIYRQPDSQSKHNYLMSFRKASILNVKTWQDTLDKEVTQADWEDFWIRCSAFTLRNNWFRRSWVVQEFALAKEVMIFCGRLSTTSHWLYDRIDWIHIFDTMFSELISSRYCEHFHNYFVLLDSRMTMVFTMERLPKELGTRTELQVMDAAVALFSFVGIIRGRDTTFDQDKVHCLLGIAQALLPDQHAALIPPAEASTSELYTWLSSLLIRYMGDLQPLSFQHDIVKPRLPKLPSWVADNTVKHCHPPINHIDEQWDTTEFRSLVHPKIEGHKLTVLGLPIGIMSFGFTLRHDQAYSFLATIQCMAYEMTRGFEQTTLYDLTGEDVVDAIFTTAFINKLAGVVPPDDDHVSPDRARYAASRHRLHVARCGGVVDYARLKSLVNSKTAITEELANLWKVRLGLEYGASQGEKAGGEAPPSIARARIMCTNNGLLCYVPGLPIPGDRVFLLQGARVPFVLRPLRGGKRWALVADAYVHGVMMGELMTDDIKARFEEITIV